MENKANYALIGMFVLLVLTAVLGFAIWLSGAQFNKQYDVYEVAFEGGVTGLTQGSEVRFNGLPVGEVITLRYDADDPNLVLAGVQVSENTPIDIEATAKLSPLGLTGLNFIEISPGPNPDAAMMIDLPGRGPKRIEGEGSAVDTLLAGSGNAVEAAQSALVRVNTLLSEDNVGAFSAILANVEAITASVDVSNLDMDKLNAMMDSIGAAADAIAATATSIEGTSETIDSVIAEDLRGLLMRAETTLAAVDSTVGEFGTAAEGVDELIIDARDAVNRLSNSGLTDLEETVDAIRRLVTTLGRVADNLEQSPAQFISGAEREEVVLPQ